MHRTIATCYRRSNVRRKATSALRGSCMLIENHTALQFVAWLLSEIFRTRVADKFGERKIIFGAF